MEIIVLGMHRSGTSLVMNLLGRLGFFIGEHEEVLPANRFNPKGYCERKDILEANKTLLESRELDWLSIHKLDTISFSDEAKEQFRASAEQIIEKLSRHRHVAIKNPLITVLLPEWRNFLTSAKFILCLRHPLEVAQSLQTRNQIPLAVGCALWEYYTLAACRNLVNEKTIIVRYREIVENPGREIGRLRKFTNSTHKNAPADDYLRNLTKQVRAELYRSRLENLNRSEKSALSKEQGALYASLADSASFPEVSRKTLSLRSYELLQLFTDNRAIRRKRFEKQREHAQRLDTLLDSFSETNKLLREVTEKNVSRLQAEQSLQHIRANVARSEVENTKLQREKEALTKELADTTAAAETANREVVRKRALAKELTKEKVTLLSELDWRNAEISKLLRQLDDAKGNLTETNRKLQFEAQQTLKHQREFSMRLLEWKTQEKEMNQRIDVLENELETRSVRSAEERAAVCRLLRELRRPVFRILTASRRLRKRLKEVEDAHKQNEVVYPDRIDNIEH